MGTVYFPRVTVPKPGTRTTVIIVIIIILSWTAWLLIETAISVESVAVLLGAVTTSVTAVARVLQKPGSERGR